MLPEEVAVNIHEVVGAAHAEETSRAVVTGNFLGGVTQQAEGDAAFSGKAMVLLDGIGADSKDVDATGTELGIVVTKGANFGSADRREVTRVKENQHWGLTPELTQGDDATVVGGQSKVGSRTV